MDHITTDHSISSIHVIHITTVHPPFDTRIFYLECRSLIRAGYKVSLLAPHSRSETVHGIQIIPVPKETNRFHRSTCTVWKAYRLVIQCKPRLVHLHDPELIPIGVLLKLFHNYKVIYDMHEYYSEVLPARVSFRFLRGPIRFIARLLLEKVPLRLFDGISFPTNRLRLEFEAASERVTLRNLPVKETSDVHTLMLDTKKEYDLVFMGAVSPSRMRFMMQVLALVSEEMSSIKWLFLGIPDATVAWAKSIDTKALLERHAVFVKQVPYPEVQDYLSKSRIGFNHHPLEKRFLVSIPMKIFEYMRAGLPVVSTALPEITELLKNGVQAILINSNNPLQYSRAIMALIRDPGRSQAIGRAAQELIRESLNWETTEYPKLLGLYSKVLNG